MKIVIYGVSASGKDHLIGDLVDYLAKVGVNLTHVSGSSTLNDLALLRHGRKFSSLGEEEKTSLRKHFIDELVSREREYGNVVVDGHFAFHTQGGTFADVFTDADLSTYDLFFYLDTEAEVVAQRSANRGCPIGIDVVRAWQDHEVEGLSARLLEAGKELHVIRDEGEPTLRYVHNAMQGEWSSEVIAREAVSRLGCLGAPGVVCLVDCDQTLVEEDTTSLIMRRHGINASGLIDIYLRDRYSNYQCFMANRWLDENMGVSPDDVEWTCGTVTPNAGLIQNLANSHDVSIVAITAGLESIWSSLIKHLGVDIELIHTGGKMSKYVKYFVVRELQRRGHFVVALGDSMLDSLMLEQADRSYIFAGKGRREYMASFLAENPCVRQLLFCPYQYPNTPSDASVCWVDYLDYRNSLVAADIALCKSTSGLTGRALREVHRRLGSLLGRRIMSHYSEEEFAVVVMMRSGLSLAEGIADELDCPMLFFDKDAGKLSKQIVECGLSERRFILADGVINTGKSIGNLMDRLVGLKIAVAACVVSSTAKPEMRATVFSARVSDNSYVGAKQWTISDGKGPDTADRLFRTM